MRRFQPAWRIGAMLTLLQACTITEALPFSPEDEHLRIPAPRPTPIVRVDLNLDILGNLGLYNTRLINDARPTVAPFPTDISYQVFQDGPGAVHPSVPHLDIPYEEEDFGGSPTIPKTNPTGVPQTPMTNQDIFLPVSTDPIPSNIPSRDDHPVKKKHIVNEDGPISTNKFYANFFLDSQTNWTWTHPYAVGWSKGNGTAKSFGLTVSHAEADLRASGEPNQSIPGHPVQFYINPVGIQSLIVSATELGNGTTLKVANPQAMSADAVLRPRNGSQSSLTFPVTQGMGFVTGVYKNLQPAINTGVLFREVTSAPSPRDGVFKYRATLEDNKSWLFYVIPDDGTDPKMQFISNTLFRGRKGFTGTIQVAKNPSGEAGEKIYDRSAGVYAKSLTVSGTANNAQGQYTFQWEKVGKDADSTPLLMFALPHHTASFDEATKGQSTDLKLLTTTKGTATAYTGDSWTMVESNLPVDMDFAPWRPDGNSTGELSEAAKQKIISVAPIELAQDLFKETNLDSMYFSGKALNKFAQMVYTVHELAGESALAFPTFELLKQAFERFVDNKQKYPLAYDSVWKGVVSTGTYETGDVNLDFGNTLYNDHHFHFGYFVLAAATMGRLDPAWAEKNKAWVNMLIRDACNPSTEDKEFPFSRGFDWYHGHSWAKGLFESADGKDEESTSEDTMFAYAQKMWGKVIGDASMEARGNLMLSILQRSLNNYFLMKKDNVNQPKNFIGNKVTGILFENKADHATYFGANLEYIQGIHMLPLLPSSAYARDKQFVKEEWDAMFAPNATKPAGTVEGGWRSILFANLALIDPAKSWNFFAQENFDLAWIDGGASRTWFLAFAAGLGGGPQ